MSDRPNLKCGCSAKLCPVHAAAPKMLEALEDLNRMGNGSKFSSGSKPLLDLINEAKGAKP